MRGSVSTHPASHRVIRYVLTIGDIQEAVHVLVDLLKMRVLSHQEFEEGSMVTHNHGVGKYQRGNHVHAIEIQVKDVGPLEDAGIKSSVIRGQQMYPISCDGYNIEVMKSPDGKHRISRVILSTDESVTMSGRTIKFWTGCLGFDISSWSSRDKSDNDDFLGRTGEDHGCCSCFSCCISWSTYTRDKFKPLEWNEIPYVELTYGSSDDFHIRLQTLPDGEHLVMMTGVSSERLILTCTEHHLEWTLDRVRTQGAHHGGVGIRKQFQFAPDKPTLRGVIVGDAAELEVCFFIDQEVRAITGDVEHKAEGELRKSMSNRRRTIVFHL